ncbi:sulfotransferase family protein [Methylomarinum vadi]|uniref:sulfotransferase family protein n=1 Tax=Methylomarinum vadi TaxID=438855 RepID=UPI00190F9DDC|nr:sulfotransferase [Methylomarinum vadi]
MKKMNELSEKIVKTLKYYRKMLAIDFRSILYSINKKRLEKPIFIIGCSRAGTTLVYKTFSESSCLGTLQKETHDFWAQLHPLSERNWDSHSIDRTLASEKDRDIVTHYFYTQTGKKRIVDKNNQNGLSVPYLYKLFPDAHFVFIKRNPGDNIDSLIKGWNKAGEFGTWADNLPETIAIDNGKYRRWCFFLAEGWRQLTKANIEEVCAFQYKAINEAILSAKKTIPTEQWHEVSYEMLIANPIDEFKKLFEGCCVPFDNAIEEHCRTILDKPYNTFSEIGVEKWKKSVNREKIERILPLVAGMNQ